MARRTPGCCCQAGAFDDEAPLAYSRNPRKKDHGGTTNGAQSQARAGTQTKRRLASV